MHDIPYGWRCENNGKVKFPFNSLLNDLKVKQSEEAASETETKRGRTVLFIDKTCVIQFKAVNRILKLLIVVAVNRVY